MLRIATSNAEVRAEFFAGVDAIENLEMRRGGQHLLRALELQPNLGIARAYHAAFSPSLTADQRKTEMHRAAADAMDASVGELLLVLALRAPAGAERYALLKAAVDAVPDDPHVNYQLAANAPDVTERIRVLEGITRKTSDFAPAYNLLAYAHGRDLDDTAAGLAMAERYMKAAPTRPNAHDTYAELLQWSGRLPEAIDHYQQALRLDADFSGAHSGLAEVAMLQGKAADARRHYDNGWRVALSQQQRLLIRQASALSYIVEGNTRMAIAELVKNAGEAAANGQRAVAAQAFRNIAVIEAEMGTKTNVHQHVRQADSLTTAANAGLQMLFAAAAYALAGDLPAARPLTNSFVAAANTSGSPVLKRQAAALSEVVQIVSGQPSATARTATTVNPGSYGALGKLLRAEALWRSGARTEARALAAEVLGYHQVDVFTLMARRRALRLR